MRPNRWKLRCLSAWRSATAGFCFGTSLGYIPKGSHRCLVGMRVSARFLMTSSTLPDHRPPFSRVFPSSLWPNWPFGWKSPWQERNVPVLSDSRRISHHSIFRYWACDSSSWPCFIYLCRMIYQFFPSLILWNNLDHPFLRGYSSCHECLLGHLVCHIYHSSAPPLACPCRLCFIFFSHSSANKV